MIDSEFIVHSRLLPFCALWARNRLVYLQSLSKHGVNFHIDILLLEFDRSRGWLWEVRTDLQWMDHFVALPFAIPDAAHAWRSVLHALARCTSWKALVNRACWKHQLQEQIAVEVTTHHQAIVQCLRQHGEEVLQPNPADELPPPPNSFGCGQCDKVFNTYHGLATHAFKKHGVQSIERQYIQFTTCAGC